MIKRIRENIIAAIISAVIVAVAIGLWGLVAGGDLIRLLGGATSDELTNMSSRVTAVEQWRDQAAMASDLAALIQRITALETRKPELGQLRLSPIPRTDVEQEEMTFGSEKGWGEWSPAVSCNSNQYVCGLRQKVEPPQGDNDDTGLNDIKFYCCYFPQLMSSQTLMQ